MFTIRQNMLSASEIINPENLIESIFDPAGFKILFEALGPTTTNPFNAEATFVHGRKLRKGLKTIKTLSCWYSSESPR